MLNLEDPNMYVWSIKRRDPDTFELTIEKGKNRYVHLLTAKEIEGIAKLFNNVKSDFGKKPNITLVYHKKLS